MFRIQTFLARVDFQTGSLFPFESEEFNYVDFLDKQNDHVLKEQLSVLEKGDLFDGFIRIFYKDQLIMDGSLERFPQYWTIIIELLTLHYFEEGSAGIEMPTYIGFKKMGGETIQLQFHDQVTLLPEKEFITSLFINGKLFLQRFHELTGNDIHNFVFDDMDTITAKYLS